MGLINSFIDPTGDMSQVDVNSETLSQVIDEMNRNSDQLDAIANNLNIINKGTITATWTGTGGISAGVTVSTPHGFGSAPIFLGFASRSDIVPTVWYPVPQWTYDNSGNLLTRSYAYTDSVNVNFNFATTYNGSPIAITFSYYILQQPAQVPTGS